MDYQCIIYGACLGSVCVIGIMSNAYTKLTDMKKRDHKLTWEEDGTISVSGKEVTESESTIRKK